MYVDKRPKMTTENYNGILEDTTQQFTITACVCSREHTQAVMVNCPSNGHGLGHVIFLNFFLYIFEPRQPTAD